MYCPTCGARLAKALSYCNHCGTNLSTLKPDGKAGASGTTTDTLVWVIVGTTITLLGMALGALVLMTDKAIDKSLGSAFVILSFVSLVLVEGVLLWRLLHLNRVNPRRWPLAQPKDLSTDELEPGSARALHAPAVSVPNVTEQTTRAFEPSYKNGE
jgi:hypothetical protein